jgi:acyl-CoA thioester hydrolase
MSSTSLAANWHELYRSVVMPAHCDLYGHMNVHHYAAFFDDAGFQILGKAGVSLADLRGRGLGTVVASLTIDFHHELTAGQLILVTGAITKVGGKSVLSEMRMYEADAMTHCATQKTVEVFFDTTRRASVAVPDDVRSKLTAAQM